jgi:hypothetical protein
MKLAAIWICERLAEMLGASILLRIIWGPINSINFPGVAGDLFAGMLLLIPFYAISLYSAIVIYFGLIDRDQSPLIQGIKISAAFLMNCVLFATLMETGGIHFGSLVLFGVITVFVVNFLGTLALNYWRSNHSP